MRVSLFKPIIWGEINVGQSSKNGPIGETQRRLYRGSTFGPEEFGESKAHSWEKLNKVVET